jgi:hypothetical protein
MQQQSIITQVADRQGHCHDGCCMRHLLHELDVLSTIAGTTQPVTAVAAAAVLPACTVAHHPAIYAVHLCEQLVHQALRGCVVVAATPAHGQGQHSRHCQ